MKEYKAEEIYGIINKEDDFIIENAVINDPIIYKCSSLKNLHFINVTFSGSVEFREVNIKDVIFNNCIFENKVIFTSSILSGKISFDDSFFNSEVYFLRTVFGQENSSGIHQIWFAKTQFLKNAYFNGACFNQHTHFNEAFFNKSVDFSEANFKRETVFIETVFADRAVFWEATFNDKALFLKTEFRHSANFNQVNFNGPTSFVETHLERIDIRAKFIKSLNLNHTTLRNSQITKETIPLELEQEKNKEYSDAREIYIMLKNNFNSIGRYEDQSWAFLKEKEMERKNFLKNKKYNNYLVNIFTYYLYGYGEKPLFTIRSSIIIIFIFAAIYWFSGSIIPNINNAAYAIPYKLNFSDSLYFSVVTFTTLGFGDWYPDPSHWVRYIVMLEAFLGVFMIGLFVFSITRRTANR